MSGNPSIRIRISTNGLIRDSSSSDDLSIGSTSGILPRGDLPANESNQERVAGTIPAVGGTVVPGSTSDAPPPGAVGNVDIPPITTSPEGADVPPPDPANEGLDVTVSRTSESLDPAEVGRYVDTATGPAAAAAGAGEDPPEMGNVLFKMLMTIASVATRNPSPSVIPLLPFMMSSAVTPHSEV